MRIEKDEYKRTYPGDETHSPQDVTLQSADETINE